MRFSCKRHTHEPSLILSQMRQYQPGFNVAFDFRRPACVGPAAKLIVGAVIAATANVRTAMRAVLIMDMEGTFLGSVSANAVSVARRRA